MLGLPCARHSAWHTAGAQHKGTAVETSLETTPTKQTLAPDLLLPESRQ